MSSEENPKPDSATLVPPLNADGATDDPWHDFANEDEKATDSGVYIKPTRRGPPWSGLGMGLTLTFSGSFVTTMILVFAAWFSLVRPERSLAVPPMLQVASAAQASNAQPAEAEPEPVVAEPTPDKAEPEAVAEAAPAAKPSPRPRQRRRRRAAPANTPAPAPAPAPATEPVIVIQPAPPPPPPPEAPANAKVHAGNYSVKSQGKRVTFELLFLGDQALTGHIKGDRILANLKGSWTLLPDGSATFSLVELGVDRPRIYSGTVHEGELSGRVIIAGKNRGKFEGSR